MSSFLGETNTTFNTKEKCRPTILSSRSTTTLNTLWEACTNGCNSNVYLVRSLFLLFEVVVRMRDLSKYNMQQVR